MKSLVTIGILALGALTLQAQQRPGARELFERARLLEERSSGLNEAVTLYEQAVAQAGSDRALAAAALLRLGLTYEKLGTGDARGALTRVLREFSDQREAVVVAQTRLASLPSARMQDDGLSTRRLLADDSYARVTDVTPDGRLALVDSAEGIVVRDLFANARTVVARRGGTAVFSPDGKYIAYSNQGLQVVASDGSSPPRSIAELGSGITNMLARAWSPDGRSVLATFVRTPDAAPRAPEYDLVWVSVADKTTRVIKSFENWQPPAPPKLSPDGRFIVYAALPRPQNPPIDTHLFIIDADGSRETAIVKIAGSNGEPVWTPDGSHLLFVNETAGRDGNLNAVAMMNGRPTAEPFVVKMGFGSARRGARPTPIAVSQSGALFYRQSEGGGSAVFVAERHPSGARVLETFPGADVAWSADGRMLACYRDSGIVIRDLTSREERHVPAPYAIPTRPDWLPDGRRLLARIVLPKQTFNLLDTVTGQFAPLFDLRRGEQPRSEWGALSPDGTTLYLATRTDAQGPWTAIVGVDVATGAERPVATLPGSALTANRVALSISPDGTRLAITGFLKGQAWLSTVRVDGSDYRELHGPFGSQAGSGTSTWTPDGRDVLFTTFTDGVSRVMRIAAAGGTPVFDGIDSSALTGSVPLPRLASGAMIHSIDVSPDGTLIVFTANTQAINELWTLQNVGAFLSGKR